MEKTGPVFSCHFQRVTGAFGSYTERLDADPHVINRARRRCEIENEIDWTKIEGLTNILLDQFKARFVAQVLKIDRSAGTEVVHPQNPVALCQKRVAEMRSQKPCGTGDQDARRSRCFSVIQRKGVLQMRRAGASRLAPGDQEGLSTIADGSLVPSMLP